MSIDKENLHVQYLYNSVIEFMYFIIIYIESKGFMDLSTLAKHVKFFKVEVEELLSSFSGSTSEEKLCSMLNMVNCFIISENKIVARETSYLKNFFIEDLILSKTIDLSLKGFKDIKDMCKNLNCSNVISISEDNLLNILQNSSHFSIENNSSVSLLHYHGVLGFEGYSCSLIVNYFQNILQHGQKLSYKEVEHHGKSVSSCGVYGMVPILCILYCNNNFHCENGQIMLNPKLKKFHKQKPLLMELRKNSCENAVPVGKIVYHTYGPYLHKWTGEICNLAESFGNIYCVVDFTDKYQDVFRLYFNKSALKLISEIQSLKDHLQIRNVVEFDAKYCHNKKFEYWKATKIEIVNCSKFKYDESLLEKLKLNSELKRKHCSDNRFCLNDFGDSYRKCFHVSCNNEMISTQLNIKEYMFENLFPQNSEIGKNGIKSLENKSGKQKIVEKECYKKLTDYDLTTNYITGNDDPKGNSDVTGIEVTNNSAAKSQESSKDFSNLISNYMLPDYLFVFGHVCMLMADKGMAVSEQGNKLLNFYFPKDSVYPATKSLNFLNKGQKILAAIPYIEEMDVVPVATFVCGLSKNDEAANQHQNPEDFAKTFLPSILKDSLQNCSNSCCNILNSLLTLQPDSFVTSIPPAVQLKELLKIITSQCNISVSKVGPIGFWKRLIKACSKSISKEGTTSYIIKLTKGLRSKKFVKTKTQTKDKRKMKKFQNVLLVSPSPVKNLEKCLSVSSLTENSKSEHMGKSSMSSLSSYKTSTNSDDTLYSCESDLNGFSTKDTVDENGSSEKLVSVDSSKDSLSSLRSDKSCITSKSTDTIRFCNSDQNSSSEASLSSYKTCTNSDDTLYSCESDLNGFSTEDTVNENGSSEKLVSVDSNKDSLNSLSSDKSCITSKSTDTIHFCNSDQNSSSEANSSDKFDSDERKQLVSDEAHETSYPAIPNCKISIKVENIDKIFEEKTNVGNMKFKKSAKYFNLQSFPFLKHRWSKKRKIFRVPNTVRSFCPNCCKNSDKVTANISLITDSFFFYSVNINGYSAVLPLPRRIVPEKLQVKMKLNSCSDIVVISNSPLNLSHILSVSVTC